MCSRPGSPTRTGWFPTSTGARLPHPPWPPDGPRFAPEGDGPKQPALCSAVHADAEAPESFSSTHSQLRVRAQPKTKRRATWRPWSFFPFPTHHSTKGTRLSRRAVRVVRCQRLASTDRHRPIPKLARATWTLLPRSLETLVAARSPGVAGTNYLRDSLRDLRPLFFFDQLRES